MKYEHFIGRPQILSTSGQIELPYDYSCFDLPGFQLYHLAFILISRILLNKNFSEYCCSWTTNLGYKLCDHCVITSNLGKF